MPLTEEGNEFQHGFVVGLWQQAFENRKRALGLDLAEGLRVLNYYVPGGGPRNRAPLFFSSRTRFSRTDGLYLCQTRGSGDIFEQRTGQLSRLEH